MTKVPNVVHAATIDPRYHIELYMDVKGARCVGNASSVSQIGAEMEAQELPNPIKKRLARNMPVLCDAVCRAVARIMTVE
jgi:hypothetical protein